MDALAGQLVEAPVILEAGFEREFEERLTDSSRLAFRLAYSVLRNREDAEEVAQEAFVKAYRKFQSLRDRARFRAWLARITWRLALDRRRSALRRERREQAVAEPPPAPTVEDLAASSEFRERLERAIAELPEKLRMVLVLAAIEGRDLREVAALLGLPEGTVKSRLFLARKNLAEKLQWAANRITKR
jgi:RNA polymerase sigma-70 factor (ECF subfamily)